jgi:hypothetical protein
MNIGRNDPCPCGSGLKHKKCCLLANDQRKLQEHLEWEKWFAADVAEGERMLKLQEKERNGA